MMMRSVRSGLALVLAAGLPVAAQTITPALVAGHPVVGVGFITTIESVAVNNSGQWLIEADTDNPDTTADAVKLRSGALFLHENQTLVGVSPGNLSSFDANSINSAGNCGANMFLRNTGSTSTDSGLFFNNRLILQESAISTAPQFAPNTPYIGFFDAKMNDSNRLFVIASVDDPTIATTVDRALVIVNYNATAGTYTESVLAKEGDTLPGMTVAVADFATTPYSYDFNNNGDAIYYVVSVGGANDAVYRNLTKLAMETDPSPIAGRTWSSLSSSGNSAAINNVGGHAYTGTLSGDTATDRVIIRNGAKFRQEGDAPPGIPGGFTLTSFGTSSIIKMADNGKVLWFGDWNDPDTTRDTALFLDDQVLLQEGVTQVNGLLVLSISSVEDGYAMSPNGRFIVAEVTLTDGVTNRNAALLIDMGETLACYANCDGSTGSPQLTANDFQCFLNKYAAGDTYANCDGSTGIPALTANDFQCFLNKYAAGCS